ncbi:hypothetical protein DCN59_20185 [Salmonella enterica]|nr:hypothetical protein [Salmonella enterica]
MYEQATATSSSINLEKRMINLLIIVLRAVVAVANALIAVLELIYEHFGALFTSSFPCCDVCRLPVSRHR